MVFATGVGLSGENVALFVPFFLGLSPVELVGVVMLYLLTAGVVFLLALVTATRGALSTLPRSVERWLVPTTLVVVGVVVVGL